jgi:hypothetical protein
MLWAWRRTVKCSANKPIHTTRTNFSISSEVNLEIIKNGVLFENAAGRTRSGCDNPLYAPKAADSIIRESVNDAPLFEFSLGWISS